MGRVSPHPYGEVAPMKQPNPLIPLSSLSSETIAQENHDQLGTAPRYRDAKPFSVIFPSSSIVHLSRKSVAKGPLVERMDGLLSGALL